MSPIQQMLLGVGAVATKTYVDDIFSTYVYTGTGSARSINNGIDLSGEGGLVWTKARSATSSMSHILFDTVRGVTKDVNTDGNWGEGTSTDMMTAFNTNGYSLGTSAYVNQDTSTFASWSFRKAPGFFDIVTYSGNGSSRTIAHSLSCVPSCIMVKRITGGNADWVVYHASIGATKFLKLNSSDTAGTSSDHFNNTAPTASVFSVGGSDETNEGSSTYVAYLFAGGSANSQALARSVSFDGSNDELYFGSTTDFEFGTGDFTWEAWIKPTSWNNNAWNTIFMVGGASQNGGIWIGQNNSNDFVVRAFSDQDILTASSKPDVGVWTHVAAARSGTTLKLFYNGIEQKSVTTSYDFQDGTTSRIANDGHNQRFTGKISNLRIVKGTAVYTSNFNPSDSLTNITNTKLLCCNDSSVTGSTVTPTTITASGGPTASADSPVFTDVAANVFGDAEDQNVIKCGSYVGNGSSTGPEITLGWEPQFIIIKESSDSGNQWRMYDSMRGMVTGGDDAELYPSSNIEEDPANEFLELTPTGFKLKTSDSAVNDNETYIFLAIRRSDGYVGKPPSLGTSVFAMDVGNSSSSIPNMDSGFPVDFSLTRTPASTSWPWFTGARLTGNKYLLTYDNNAEQTASDWVWDSNEGWMKGGNGNTVQSWMWKRHAGFDVVTFQGSGSARLIPHSMNAIPEFIIVKNRETANNQWYIYHKGLNGGTNPEDYYVKLGASGDAAEAADAGNYLFNSIAPTSTHFSVGTSSAINESGKGSIAMLFASVDGISKVGYYDGSDSSQTITTGFQPRFLILKRATAISGVNNPWYVLDTTRGWGSGDDKYLELQTTGAQGDFDFGAPTSTGFTLIGNNNGISKSGHKYIYYAHA